MNNTNKFKLDSLKSVELLNDEELKMVNGGLEKGEARKYDSYQYDSKKKDTFPDPPPPSSGRE